MALCSARSQGSLAGQVQLSHQSATAALVLIASNATESVTVIAPDCCLAVSAALIAARFIFLGRSTTIKRGPRPHRDTAMAVMRRGCHALAGATGPFLLVRLAGGVVHLAASFGGLRPLAAVGHLRLDGLMDQATVHFSGKNLVAALNSRARRSVAVL